MKKLLLFSMVLCICMASFGQAQRSAVSKRLQDISVPRSPHQDVNPVKSINGTVSSKSTLEEIIIGATRYDAQTNGSTGSRLYLTDDGKEGAVWTRGMLETSYTDRGTGYNFTADGSSWLPAPTARIETVRAGWPQIAQWNGNGEIIISHQSGTLPLILNKRSVAGTGAWTQSFINPPSGASGLLWPSIMTSGANHEFLHMLVETAPTTNGGAVYQGLDGALLYYRSSDGGTTWDINGVVIPPMTSSNYFGFSGDGYVWANPKGDTIAFMVGDNWTDTFVMESFDNGTTWTKIPILSNANSLATASTIVEPFYCNDGSNAVAIDKDGKIHAAFGRMRASNTDGTGKVYYPYTDGIVYWNQDMPMIQDSLYLDTLDAHGQLVGYVVDPGTGDSIHAIPYYGSGMSSFINLTVDPENRLILVSSNVTVGNTSPDDMNYRHLWARGYDISTGLWQDMRDLNEGLIYVYREFVYPFMAKNSTYEKVYMIYQTADVPGSAIQTTSAPFVVPVHDNNIEHRDVLKEDILIIGVNEHKNGKEISLKNFPNPCHGSTTIAMELPKASKVTFTVTDITGHIITNVDKGMLHSGVNTFDFNAESLSAGVYFYSVNINGIAYTNRMIVQ